jgi:iron complex outermembrane receptor protein
MTVAMRGLGLGAALSTLFCSAAWAQAAPTGEQARADGTRELGEVVVTARRRSEALQEVPVAVTAVSGSDLAAAGAVTTEDLSKMAPGLYYRASDPSKPQIYVRGVGTRGFDAGSDASVATFVDGVYIGRFGGQIQNVADLQRIEVLKGPQGALFGRNTIGGAINVVTRKPGQTFESHESVTYGRAAHFDGEEIDATALVSGPLSDTISGQFAFARNDADGPMQETVTGRLRDGGGEASARARLVWSPDRKLDIDLVGDVFASVNSDLTQRSTDVGGRRTAIFLAAPGTAPPPIDPDPFRASQTPGLGGIDIKGGGLSATATFAAAGFDFTSISAVRHINVDTSNDLDGTALSILNVMDKQDSTQVSQELRLASRPGGVLTFNDRIDWLLGLYYYREDTDGGDRLEFGPASVATLLNGGRTYADIVTQNVRTRSYAMFGQVGVRITEKLKLDVALRYGQDDKSAHLALSSPAARPGVITSPYDVHPGRSDSSVDPTVALSYKVSGNLLVYASYATGFKGGAFQYNALSAGAANQVAEPEALMAYQGGFKADLLDRRLRLDVAGFHYDYHNLQLSRFVTPPGGGVGAFTTVNAARSTINGVEVEGAILVGDHLTVDYGYAFLDAKYDRYLFTDRLDYSGNRMTRSPRNAGNLALTYVHPTGLGDLTFRGSMNFVDSFFFEADNAKVDPGTREPAHTTFDASAKLAKGRYEFTLWGRNLGDEAVRSAVASAQSGTRLLEVRAPRRTIGFTISSAW